MPYCPRCGVETDPSVRACPLCRTVLPRFSALGPGEPAWPSQDELDPSQDPAQTYATSGQRRGRALFAVFGIFATAALAVTASDLFTSGGVSWSRWPLVCLAAAFLLTASVLVWHRRPAFWTPAWGAIILALLASLDLCGGTWNWFPTVALPITATTFGLIAVGVTAARPSRRGYYLFGLVPGLAAAELVTIDLVVTLWTTGRFVVGWSLVTSLVLVPLALLFFFLHYALHRAPDLKRIFHF